MAGWTQRKQALHDMAAGTCVVRKDGLLRFRQGEFAAPPGLQASGMPAWAIVLIVLGCCVFLVVPILAAIAIPAYQDYTIRSQVSEGMALADGGKTAVAEFYSNYGHYPNSNASAGLASASSISGNYVGQVAIGADGGNKPGVIAVSYGGPKANAHLAASSVLLIVPTPQGGQTTFQCGSTTIEGKYLPASCRGTDPALIAAAQIPASDQIQSQAAPTDGQQTAVQTVDSAPPQPVTAQTESQPVASETSGSPDASEDAAQQLAAAQTAREQAEQADAEAAAKLAQAQAAREQAEQDAQQRQSEQAQSAAPPSVAQPDNGSTQVV